MSRSNVTIDTRDGHCNAHVFRPDSAAGPWPAVLVFMDGIGMRPALHDIGDRIAAHGYFVLLPDLFYRGGPYEPIKPSELFGNPEVRQAWFSKYFPALTPENVKSDVAAFLEFLGRQSDVVQPEIGTTGYCMGGRISFASAANFPDRIAAAAAYHPGGLATDAPDSPHLLSPRIKARVYVGGASEDPSFTDEQKATLEDALTRAGVDHVIETYPARHGWVPSDTPVHDAEQAERHYRTLFELLDGTLKSG